MRKLNSSPLVSNLKAILVSVGSYVFSIFITIMKIGARRLRIRMVTRLVGICCMRIYIVDAFLGLLFSCKAVWLVEDCHLAR